MKEHLPPTPQQSSPASRVIPRAPYWGHVTAAVAAMLLVALHLGHAKHNVSLAWDENPEPDIAKYKVNWGVESGAPTESLDVGKVTAATVRNLDDGATYFFTVTAINDAGQESEPSNEVFYTTTSQPPRHYTLTVVRGSGSDSYRPGIWVPVHADPPRRGEQFDSWDGDTTILKSLRTDADNEVFTIEENVTITAVYSALPSFIVTVINGTGDGNYYTGETVQIVADETNSQQFKGWTGNATFANALSSTTTFTMPASDVDVTAIYSLSEYPLTVTNGTGSSKYLVDAQITITGRRCPSGPTVCRVEWKRERCRSYVTDYDTQDARIRG